MLDVFISTDIEMPFTGREKALSVLEYAWSQSSQQDCAACICEEFLRTVTNSNADIGHGTRTSKRRKVVCAGENDLYDQKHHKRRLSVSVKKSCKTKEIITTNKSGNPDSTNNSLAHPEEMLDN